MVWLRWKCTGTPTRVDKHDYPTEYKVNYNNKVSGTSARDSEEGGGADAGRSGGGEQLH